MALSVVLSTVFKNLKRSNSTNRSIFLNSIKRSINCTSEISGITKDLPKSTDLCTTFYHRYSHPSSSWDVCFVPEIIPSTKDCLNLYFDESFCAPFNHEPVEEAKQIIKVFYNRYDVYKRLKSLATITDDFISAGSLIDSNHPRLLAHCWIQNGLFIALDDIFETLILENNKTAKFGIEMMKSFWNCLDRPGQIQPDLVCNDVPDRCVEEINLFRNIWIDSIKYSENMWSASNYRAWRTSFKFFLRMWIDFEQLIIRSERNEPIKMIGYQLSRTETVGLHLLSTYLLNENWNLDLNYRYDNYYSRLTALLIAYGNDIMSFSKEIEAGKEDPMKNRVMSYPLILVAEGMSHQEAILITVQEFNRYSITLNSMYNDPQFEDQRNFFYANMRSHVKYAHLQANLQRYGWSKII